MLFLYLSLAQVTNKNKKIQKNGKPGRNFQVFNMKLPISIINIYINSYHSKQVKENASISQL